MVAIEIEAKCFKDAHGKVTENSRHQCIDSIKIVEPDVVYSNEEAVEENHVAEVEIEAKFFNDTHGNITENSRHPSIGKINIVEPNVVCSKGQAAEEEHMDKVEIEAKSALMPLKG